jgi:hypothetical protein
MPFFIVFLVTPIVVAVALYRRNPRRFWTARPGMRR